MRTSVTKIFKFESAHILTNSYSVECQNIHGHSYKLEVTFEGKVNEDGMVMDFKKIKEIVKPLVDMLDHSIIINTSPSDKGSDLCEVLTNLKQDVVPFDGNPTAENMAMWFFDNIRKRTHLITKVKLWETETGFVEVTY